MSGVDFSSLPDWAWRERPSRLPKHIAIRAERGETMPEGANRVAILASGGHHTSWIGSIVAVRDEGGAWRVEERGTRSSGLLRIEPENTSRNWILSAAAGARLDAILADPCLPLEPPNYTDMEKIYVGMTDAEIDIEAADRTLSISRVNVGRSLGSELFRTVISGA